MGSRDTIAALLACGLVLGLLGMASTAGAGPKPGPVDRWMTKTAAASLERAAPRNDPAAAGLFALNQTFRGAFKSLRRQASLPGLESDLSLDRDLRIDYRLSYRRSLLPNFRHGSVHLQGAFAYREEERSSARFGLEYASNGTRRPFSLGLVGEQRQHAGDDWQETEVGCHLRLLGLRLSASAVDHIPDQGAGDDLRGDRLLDIYELGLNGALPFAPWASLEARREFRDARTSSGDANTVERLNLHLRPFGPLSFEGGTVSRNRHQSTWHARFRVTLDLG